MIVFKALKRAGRDTKRTSAEQSWGITTTMSFFADLKRRNVFRVATAYVIVGWLVIQVVETIFPAFGFGDAAVRIVVIVLAVGFVPVMIFAWVFELTPEGLKKEKDIDRSKPIAGGSGNRLNFVIIGLFALSLGYFAYDKLVLGPGRIAAASLNAVEGLAEVRELVGERLFAEAYRRARELDSSFTDESLRNELWQSVSRRVSLTSNPAGAHVWIRAYNSEEEDWEDLGQTPLEDVRVPGSMLRIRLELDGYQTLTVAGTRGGEYRLEAVDSHSQEMLRVQGAATWPAGPRRHRPWTAPGHRWHRWWYCDPENRSCTASARE